MMIALPARISGASDLRSPDVIGRATCAAGRNPGSTRESGCSSEHPAIPAKTAAIKADRREIVVFIIGNELWIHQLRNGSALKVGDFGNEEKFGVIPPMDAARIPN